MEKEKWIEDAMNSVGQIKRTEPNPFLFTRIEERIKTQGKSGEMVSLPQLSFTFAGIVLLIVLNVSIVKKRADTNMPAETYSLQRTNYQIY